MTIPANEDSVATIYKYNDNYQIIPNAFEDVIKDKTISDTSNERMYLMKTSNNNSLLEKC